MDRFSRAEYERLRHAVIVRAQHGIDNAAKDQWFNALVAFAAAGEMGVSALQQIVNRQEWPDDGMLTPIEGPEQMHARLRAEIESLRDDVLVEQAAHRDTRDTMNRCNAEAFTQRTRADAAELEVERLRGLLADEPVDANVEPLSLPDALRVLADKGALDGDTEDQLREAANAIENAQQEAHAAITAVAEVERLLR